jgi:hypothetical protein
MARRSNAGTTRAGLITTVNMTTGEILDVGPGHSELEVRRLVRKAQRRRAELLRTASVTHWHLSRVSS